MAVSLPALDALDRNLLTDSQGRTFKEFRRTLTPRWFRVWADIGAGYAALGLIFWALVFADQRYPRALPLTAIAGALSFGYVIASIQLFLHEAAHYNLAPGRKLNDRLATVFLGWMAGQELQIYRALHFDHHRFLGTPNDTEHNYFDAANVRFVVESLTGIKVVRRFLARPKRAEGGVQQGPSPRLMLLVGFVLNLAIVGAALWNHSWAVALAWPLGMLVVHPAINTMRQLLEHRSFEARSDIDYTKQAHGPVTRMFGGGPIASTLGAAGFNRHLLHHWEPQLSYTRFAELEAFLLDTAAADVLRSNTTTHARAFSRLMRAP